MRRSSMKTTLCERALPNALLMPNGKTVSSKEEWESIMRPHWTRLFWEEEYGQMPLKVIPQIKVIPKEVDFAGKGIWEEISFTFHKDGKTHTVLTQLIYPREKKNNPFFIMLNFRADIPDRYLPVEEILDNGFGVFSVCYNDVTKDDADFTDGLAGLFQKGERNGNDAGKLVYWSYMALQMMDYLQTLDIANKNQIGVVGHSRLGKTALITAIADERFAFVCANDSGCSGAALSRGKKVGNETLRDITKKFPYWFCPNYINYVDKEQKLPFDQHCLLSLIAPRAAYIGAAIEDVWADNEGQFLACKAASAVWKLYGKKGLISPNRIPLNEESYTKGELGFYLRNGKHYLSRTDWNIYMKAVKRYFKLKK